MQEKDTLDHQPARHRLHDGGDDPQHQLVYHSPPCDYPAAMGYRQSAQFRLPRQRAAVFYDLGLPLFWERSAQPRHFWRIGLCIAFYSALSLLYITLFTHYQRRAVVKEFAAEARLLPPVVFLCYHRHLPALAAASG